MGKRGPPRKPTKLLELEGSWRGKARPNEPKPKTGTPRRPANMTKKGAAVWRELMPQLAATGVATKLDGRAFARYCELYAQWQELQEFLADAGMVHLVKDAAGKVIGVKAYPQARLALQVSEHLLRLEQQFGLTPSARASLIVEGRAGNDEAESPFRRRTG